MAGGLRPATLEEILPGGGPLELRSRGAGPAGTLPLTAALLADRPSGDLFGWTQDAGMGWDPAGLGAPEFLILSTQGGIRNPDGRPLALGYHTGHWEVGLLMQAAAEELRGRGFVPFAAYCTDPCDGRSQGTTGMFDSLPYRNDAAVVLRRLIRSLPTRRGLLGIGTCDKGLPAMMMALAGSASLPAVLVPGGVTLPAEGAEDAGAVQSIGARFAHGLLTLEAASALGCRACGSPGGGCQFLGTAATAQVVGEALGMSLPHSALAPSGQPIWLDMARRSARALTRLEARGMPLGEILTREAVRNAMVAHAAFGGSTNLLLHIPAIAHAAGLPRPTLEEWVAVNRSVPRLVDALPNGPRNHPTIQVFLAGGVPEVLVHLRRLGLLETRCLTATGETLGQVLDWWEGSERRAAVRARLRDLDGVDPDDVILDPERAEARGLTSTVTFPRGNLAPEGAVIKSTAIDPSVVGADGVYRKVGPARVFTTERAAIAAIKSRGPDRVRPGDVVPRAAGRRHGGDLPGHRGAQVPALGEGGRGPHRRALLGRLDRGLHRARRPRGARRRADRQGARRRPHRDRDRSPGPHRQRRSGRRRGRPRRARRGGPPPGRAGAALGPRSRSRPAPGHAPVGGAAGARRRRLGRVRV
jgi:putative YjhG/YagF family dehydratase